MSSCADVSFDSCAVSIEEGLFDEIDEGTMEHQQQNNNKDKEELARQETAAVFRLRLLVFLVLLLAAIGVSVIVFYITSGAAREESKTQYAGAAEKVLEKFDQIVDLKLPAVSSVGVASIAHGVDHIRTWPFVTLSSFQQRSATARSQSGALYVHMNPLVTEDDQAEWQEFLNSEDAYWIREGYDYQDTVGLFDFAAHQKHSQMSSNTLSKANDINLNPVPIWYYQNDHNPVVDPGPGPYLPTWQTSPVFENTLNQNLLRTDAKQGAQKSLETQSVVISEFLTAPSGGMDSDDPRTAFFALLLSTTAQEQVQYQGDPMSQVFFPIFDSFADDRTPVAILVAWINWASYFVQILPNNMVGIDVVLQDSCSGVYSYRINGEQVVARGSGDLHEREYNHMRRSSSFASVSNIADGTKHGLPLNQQHCQIKLDVYPSTVFYDTYKTKTPIVVTFSVAIIFVFTACMFLIYDRLVERRQALVMWKAGQTAAIVSSLFPDSVRDRLIRANDRIHRNHSLPKQLQPFMSQDDDHHDDDNAPIADLFPHCTVLFADISGFTAWSSARHPAEVFVLLQTVYQAFDAIANKRKVFKVETIGDSYMAVTGLPEPQEKHAVIMARFAGDCMVKMNRLVADLEKTLGPDTGDLSMRFGLHSGPVTAGVLRGDRARFQLFGDTVNTASRMESTGIRNKIQVSEATRDLLVAAGKGYWLSPRPDPVQAKGKGALNTFWLTPNSKKTKVSRKIYTGSDTTYDGSTSTACSHDTAIVSSLKKANTVNLRLVDWMVDMFKEQIAKIMAQREVPTKSSSAVTYTPEFGSVPLDDVTEVILLPRYNAKASARAQRDPRNIELGTTVLSQLHEYVATIAATYLDNPFHNFEHACHVAMSAHKFMKRIVSPDLSAEEKGDNFASKLHEYTLGINSDPLTVCAILFSALVHDCDHRGVSNQQLGKEQRQMADKYGDKSIAEQNSLDIAWALLMEDQFKDLRGCLFTSDADLARFRQVVVNVVLATDIFDKELNDLRKNRWCKAFDSKNGAQVSNRDKNDLRATIVIEHIIQASDVSHTMQHWHIYRKWNERLFLEMHSAYKAGRMAKDPTTFWYKGELSFFDNYVIPLAKKLKDCNVFGVSSDECLNYAMQNRAEWADRGQAIVAELKDQVTEELGNVMSPDNEKK